ncbi:MAG: hypothetical protein IJJ26_00115 [Victivallales bacterium]|nr:hypothetical protein [Victivallales bacterium]
MKRNWSKQVFWMVLCAGLVTPMALPAQEAEEGAPQQQQEAQAEADDEWKEERKELEKKIRQMTDEWLKKNVTKPILTKGLALRWRAIKPAWSWPLLKPKRSLAAVREDLEKRMEAQYRKENREPTVKELTEAGREKYKMYQVGDIVKFKIRDGKGVNTIVEGRLTSVSFDFLRIGQRFVNRVDMDNETLALFYKDINDQMVDEYVKHEQRVYAAKLGNFVDENVQEQLAGEILKEGYVPKQMKPNAERSPNLARWETREEFMDKLYKKVYEEMKARKTKEFEEKVYKEAEYVYVKEAKEWMPVDVAETYRANLANQQKPNEGEGEGMEGGEM